MKRVVLFLRGAIPLLFVAALLIALPTLLAWWLIGGAFSWHHLAFGLGGAVLLLAIGGTWLGWAMGRFKQKM